ncbi:phosphotriesterase [Streptomyces sp. CFMR 7]|uniref:phosphotriesterase family protein n=1 Tax=Streptomyces sp. CFMR 7 TaxID=1649184 RepID=UPI0037D9AAB4
MVNLVRTVLGDVPADELGICDAHDHLFLRSPRLPGQELDDPERAAGQLEAFRALGGGTVVQWTPYGMGRRAADLAALSASTGVHVVAATGLHQAAHYAPEVLHQLGRSHPGSPAPAHLPDPARLSDLFVAELAEGIGESGVRAGMIKVAGAFHGVDAHARRTMTAAAEAHHRTGAPIGVHLELGTGALDVLDLLCGELEAAPGRVLLGHLGRCPDGGAQREAGRAGGVPRLRRPLPGQPRHGLAAAGPAGGARGGGARRSAAARRRHDGAGDAGHAVSAAPGTPPARRGPGQGAAGHGTDHQPGPGVRLRAGVGARGAA